MPEWKREVLRRLAPLRLAPTREAEIADELAQHLEDRYQELLATGQSEHAAFRTAIDELKGEDFLARDLRPVERYRKPMAPGKDSNNVFAGIFQDLRYALRMLRKSPGFTAVALLTLALGIGANTAIFSVINGVLLSPLPYKDSQQLVVIKENDSLPNVIDIQREVRAFSQGGGINVDRMDYTGGAEPVQVRVGQIDAGFLETLNVQAMLGRIISRAEDVQGAPRLVMVSNASGELLDESARADGDLSMQRIDRRGRRAQRGDLTDHHHPFCPLLRFIDGDDLLAAPSQAFAGQP